MPTIGEYDYKIELSGEVVFDDSPAIKWKATKASIFYEPKLTAFFVEVGVRADAPVGDISVRVQVESEDVDIAGTIAELDGIIEEVITLRAMRVIRKAPNSTHRTLLVVV